MSSKTSRIAVVGLGKMGLLHASILNTMPNVQLAAICEKNSFTRKLCKKTLPSIPVVGIVQELSGLDLDVVYVTTPISSHFSVAKTVLQERLARHVFVEKPLASNYHESKELTELVLHTGSVNMVGYLRRFMVTFIKAKELVVQGAIGDTLSFTTNAFSSDFYGIRERPEIAASRGGVLRDLGCYAIDIVHLDNQPKH